MEYVIPLVLVLVLVGGFVTFLTMNATRRGEGSERSREADGPPGMGQDDTPLGDTSEHAGEQTSDGATVRGQDAEGKGGTGQPVQSGYAGTSAAGEAGARDGAHVRRSGEAEGAEAIPFEDVEPPRAKEVREGRRPGAHPAGAGSSQQEQEQRQGDPEPEDDESDRTSPASERLADRGF